MAPRNHFITTIIILTLWGCTRSIDDNTIMTVTGAIANTEMGIALIHEHVLVDFIGAAETGYHRWNRDQVVQKVLPYLEEARDFGVATLLECTPAYLGRDPVVLRMLSERSGVRILTNTGYYGALDDRHIPAFAYQIDADSMAQIWIKEFEHGIEQTGIRPGFIKISVDDTTHLSEIDEKLVRAAIITHRATGLTIVAHTATDGPAFTQLDILEEEGISPEAWVWTHAQEGTPEGLIKAARKGAWISIDNVSLETLDATVNAIITLRSAGRLNRLLISHDAGWFDPDAPAGGEFRGYTAIFEHLLPALRKHGLTQSEIDQILIDNPRNAYSLRVRTR